MDFAQSFFNMHITTLYLHCGITVENNSNFIKPVILNKP